MKRKHVLVLTAALAVTAACHTMAAEEVAGEWYGNMFGMAMTLTLDESGNYTMEMGDEEPETGTWELDGETLYIDKGTEYESAFAYDGETLYADMDGMEFVFSQDPEAAAGFEPAAARTDAALEEFAGFWTATQVSAFGMTTSLEMIEVEKVDLEIVDNKINFTMAGGFMFGEWQVPDLEGTLADGVLTFVMEAQDEYSEDTTWNVQLLEDGTMSLSSVMLDEELVFYMECSEAEAETEVVGGSAEAEVETEAADVPAEVSAGGAEFAGTWTSSDTGTLELKEDGTCVVTWLDGSSAEMTWEETEEGATITSGNWWGCVMVLEDANTLNIDSGWVVMNREDGAVSESAVSETTSDTVSETEASVSAGTDSETVIVTPEDYIGTWHCAYLSAGVMEGDPRAMYGLNITLVLNEDGTGTIDYPEQEDGIWYEGEYNYMYFGQGGDNADMPMKYLKGDFIQYGTELAGYLVFSQDPEAVWTPDMLEAETEAGALQTPAQSMPETSEGTAVAAGEMEERLDTKFVAVNADVGGYVMEASMLGGEFSVTFNSDGTLTLIMVGADAPGLTWTQGTVATENGEADAFIVNYYNTNTLEFVATEAGFDLNYFDSMILHFVPEA